ncbi:MAG TPA: alpha/beta hydrolase [Solirubrobacteraceae bacterium]
MSDTVSGPRVEASRDEADSVSPGPHGNDGLADSWRVTVDSMSPDEVAAHNSKVLAEFGEWLAAAAKLEVSERAEVRVERDIEFSIPGDGESLLLDLYLPARPVGLLPTIVWLHGGGWRLGDRSLCPDLERYFACRGYAMANIEYRLSGRAKFPAALEDVRAAIRWVRTNAAAYGLDQDAVGLWGSSAGAHLGSLAATTAREERDRVQAVVDGYGPTDFELADRQSLGGGLIHDDPQTPETEFLGVRIGQADPALLRACNPVAHVTPAAPPFLIMHGTADLVVAPDQSKLLHEALVSAGVESTLYFLEGVSHGFFNGRLLEQRPTRPVRVFSSAGGEHRELDGPPPTLELIERFFDRHLRWDPWRVDS